MYGMRMCVVVSFVALLNTAAVGQTTTKVLAFDVASVRPSERMLGPDANNRFAITPAGLTGKNVTLRRLVAEAYHLHLRQVLGPSWLDEREYDVEAKAGRPVTRDDLALMLRTLLADRFRLQQHRETRELRVYELVNDGGGIKIHPIENGAEPSSAPGMHFRGEMRQFADLLAVQLTIVMSDDPGRPGRAAGAPVPVFDKTGLPGIYDFSVDIRPEPGTDMFALWQRALRDQLGLRLNGRRSKVDVLVIDSADQLPTAN